MASTDAHPGGVDTNLYSRQIGVFGMETMGKLVKMDVLIVGMRGLGIEIAKNVCLAGPRSVTIFDPEPATIADVGTNFYLSPASVGTPRAGAVIEQLAELNSYVHTTVLPGGALTEDAVGKFHVVVMTNAPRGELLRWDAFCRGRGIVFLAADVRGVAGFAFSDFGPEHVVRDPNGEAVRSAIVTDVTRDAQAVVFTHDAKRHGFDEGDYVTFREVEGMGQLNDGVPRRVVSAKPFSFVIDCDTRGYDEYIGSGVAEQTKVPKTVAHAPLAALLASPLPAGEPMMITPDLGKFGRPEQLHVAFQAVEEWRAAHGGALPGLRNAAHADEVVAAAKAWHAANKAAGGGLAAAVEAVDEGVVRTLALTAAAELPALCAFFGGVVAQEVVKATGKFTPLNQLLYLDAFEVLPPGHEGLPAAEFAPSGSRYDGLVGLLGRSLQAAVASQRLFVVGAGALGCEFLKNWALMGAGCGPGGRVTVTDMDRIEVSNLNRQFLFRGRDVGQPKSVTAASAARAMNPDLKVAALETPVGEDTEGTFNDAFWDGLDVVVNALDNLKARTYVDGRCVFYGLPLLESGTLGTKANCQVIVPHATESYADSVDPPEESIPMCTLRNFPHAIEHCIEWARDVFAGSYSNAVQDAAAFLANPAGWLAAVGEEGNLSSRRGKLQGVADVLAAATGADWATCVRLAREAFNAHFTVQIAQLLHNFPLDYADPATGVKFWSGPKRPPVVAEFSPADPGHFAFVVHAAALYAFNFGVPLPHGFDSHEVVDPILAATVVPPFVPKSVKIKANDADATVEGADDDGDAVAALSAKLTASAAGLAAAGARPLNLAPAEFEKDDDTNHHVAFITAAANLRARNYRIKEATRYEVKMTAGKIIPAIATTTAMVTGLVAIELYKVVQKKAVDVLRNGFVNLAVNVYSLGEPGAPKKTRSVEFDPIACGPVKARPEGFTRWDKVVLREGSLTPLQLEAALAKLFPGCAVNMITSGKSILYNPLLYKAHKEQRANKPLVDIAAGVPGAAPLPPGRKYLILDVSCFDDDGDVLIPQVQMFFE